jgi:hypothetical protein
MLTESTPKQIRLSHDGGDGEPPVCAYDRARISLRFPDPAAGEDIDAGRRVSILWVS